MGYDEFFTDGDKPYAENLNDSLLLMDAFDVTVPCELPDMFNNGEFSSTVDAKRKAGIAIVTLKSVDEGVTVGTDSISGTGEVVFRIYPNFNSFYKWYSIVLEKTGTVSVDFKKTDGTSISATVGTDGVISEASALKELQEIDVVFTLTSATITNILIKFRNNQSTRTRTGALLEASQLTNVNGSIESENTEAVSGGTVYETTNALDNRVSTLESSTEKLSNKTTSLTDSDTQYPTSNAVKTVTDGKANTVHTHTKSQITDLANGWTLSQEETSGGVTRKIYVNSLVNLVYLRIGGTLTNTSTTSARHLFTLPSNLRPPFTLHRENELTTNKEDFFTITPSDGKVYFYTSTAYGSKAIEGTFIYPKL